MTYNDTELIGQILDGSTDAFDILMQRYQNLVYTIGFTYGKSQDNAMDITQNVFMKAYQKLPTFRADSSFKSWLSRIARNEGINWARNNKGEVYLDVMENRDDLFTDGNPSQEDELLAREHRAELLKSLFSLNTKYRLAVVLRYYRDMPIREIAATMKCSEGVVKNMLFRSLQRLRKQLNPNRSS
ncbi:MAG: sigma-70 family RNA polymerase sigma factor [Caldithrix sp.]|nr:sigma-70 family RNA polymerase sigma factor [Caldithrix sp.]